MSYYEDDKERRLDALLAAYRESADEFEAGPNFLPGMWNRIESRRSGWFRLERVARAFATAALVIAVITGLLVATPDTSANSDDTWIETLANQQLAQNTSYYEPVRLSAASHAEHK